MRQSVLLVGIAAVCLLLLPVIVCCLLVCCCLQCRCISVCIISFLAHPLATRAWAHYLTVSVWHRLPYRFCKYSCRLAALLLLPPPRASCTR
ncbi:hypothetical protein [Methanimicrococcus hacksteinii]|uniref:hypothetical protein n=1 Tax=Methanimicrococcus hacksteinii TaxID=3028293 RepID=UPI00298F3A75|nr:hypothetical protein [Methanimicrococcus sp. At1]